MPTPFYHLSIADTLLKDSQLEPALRQFLRAQRPAFLLGHTAPDVQTISGQARRETHFFELPVERHQTPPWEKMLRLFPELEAQALGKPARTAFIAGYLCHLQADWLWILELFAPIFGPDQTWAAKNQPYFYHNVLRAYLDEQIISTLPHSTGGYLLHAVP
ncbi:MAG TPA: zinc dependent phospholipase C family protein, partial [Anaerolineales bacterium]|nr:zinc dependent phospholipase C family protein [Anaerolineales bacterium]